MVGGAGTEWRILKPNDRPPTDHLTEWLSGCFLMEKKIAVQGSRNRKMTGAL